MHRLYGTYLVYLVEEHLRQTEAALSIKEIAAGIATLDTTREQYNLQERVRRALVTLENDSQVQKEMHRVATHIFSFKYKIKQHAERPEFS